MKKILFINNAAIIVSGSHYYTHIKNGELMKRMINDGYEVSAFQFLSTDNSISNFDLGENDIKVFPQKKYKQKGFSYFVAYLNLFKLVFKYDFIYIYYPNSFKYIIPIFWIMRKHYALYIRGMNGVTSTFSKWAYKYADFIIETSRFAEAVGCKALLPRPMINYNISDIYREREYKFKSNKGVLNILFLGRLDLAKGLIELVDAVYKLKEASINCRVTIVGDGPAAEIIRTHIKNSNVEDIVELYGAEYDPEKIKELYINADVYILPTYHEGFPRTIYEAMIFGTPIITTMVGGIPTVMTAKHNCLEIKPRSAQSIYDVVIWIYSNYDKAILYAQNAFEDVAKVMYRESHADTLLRELNKIFLEQT